MNILELENLVKGAPDDYLIKEVQAPSGKIPQFLALSEVQRRKDMRERFQAQQNGGQKPTIAEQITGGGIGSLPGAPVQTPSATGVPSAGAPPVATGAAPMPSPASMPQGFAKGGVIGYAEGGTVMPLGAEVRSATPYLDAMNAPAMQYQAAPGGIGDMLALAAEQQAAPAAAPAPAPFKNLYGMTPTQVKLAEMLTDPNAAKLPDAINYDDLIAQAGQSEKEVREAAKREAIGAALVKLGAGLASGNLGAGLSAAGDDASQIMRQGRADASAERRVAQQLSMQAKQGQREQAMQEKALERDNLVALATMESQSKAQAEQKAYQLQSLAQSAAASERSYALQLRGQNFDEKRYEDTKKTSAVSLVGSALEIAIGKPPSATEMSAWVAAEKEAQKKKVPGKDGKMVTGTSGIPNPQAEYERKMREALPVAIQFASEQTGVDMGSLSKLVAPPKAEPSNSTPQAAVKPDAPKANSKNDVLLLKKQGYTHFTAPDGTVRQIK